MMFCAAPKAILHDTVFGLDYKVVRSVIALLFIGTRVDDPLSRLASAETSDCGFRVHGARGSTCRHYYTVYRHRLSIVVYVPAMEVYRDVAGSRMG